VRASLWPAWAWMPALAPSVTPDVAPGTPRYNAVDAEEGGRGNGPSCGQARRPYRALHRADEGGATRVWRALDESVQHFGCAGVRMDQPARLYLCARCRVQVVLCSRCDRGNRYCGASCWREARTEARRQAAQRYQRSWRGRIAHARRSQRWRQRRAARDAARAAGEDAQNVTHQGSRPGQAWAPLAAWTHDSTTATPAQAGADLTAHGIAQEPPIAAVATACWRCRRCGARQPAALRLGFVRHGLPGRRRHDHSP